MYYVNLPYAGSEVNESWSDQADDQVALIADRCSSRVMQVRWLVLVVLANSTSRISEPIGML